MSTNLRPNSSMANVDQMVLHRAISGYRTHLTDQPVSLTSDAKPQLAILLEGLRHDVSTGMRSGEESSEESGDCKNNLRILKNSLLARFSASCSYWRNQNTNLASFYCLHTVRQAEE